MRDGRIVEPESGRELVGSVGTSKKKSKKVTVFIIIFRACDFRKFFGVPASSRLLSGSDRSRIHPTGTDRHCVSARIRTRMRLLWRWLSGLRSVTTSGLFRRARHVRDIVGYMSA